MATNKDQVNLTLLLTQENSGADELDLLARHLLVEIEDILEDSDIESVSLASDKTASIGAKGDEVTLGILVVVLLQYTLPKLLEFLQAWSLRDEGRSLKIKIQRDNQLIEIELPSKTRPNDVKDLLDLIKDVP